MDTVKKKPQQRLKNEKKVMWIKKYLKELDFFQKRLYIIKRFKRWN